MQLITFSLFLLQILSLVYICRAEEETPDVQLDPFTVPDVKIQALNPKGLRVTIPDVPGLQFFAFHGQRNKPLTNVEPGEFTEDITQPSGTEWVFFDPKAQLAPGDVLHYWYFVQHTRLGYRREDQSFKIDALVTPAKEEECKTKSADTVFNLGKVPCAGALIFEDNFVDINTLNDVKWQYEQYIPFRVKEGPDYEFVTYINDSRTAFIKNKSLFLKPIKYDGDIRSGTISLSGCTRNKEHCEMTGNTFLILPPILAGKIRSKFSFKYGRVEIRAKLPKGDWIYPVVSLISVNREKKIWIAYSRGNDRLTGNAGDDIGSRYLFAGPLQGDKEPARSSKLKTRSQKSPYYSDYHTYGVNWVKDKISFSIDGETYAEIRPENFITERIDEIGTGFLNQEYQIHLGVGVGGQNDFPDGYMSGSTAKPWTNGHPKSMANFYTKMDTILTTWGDDDSALKIDYVKVFAL